MSLPIATRVPIWRKDFEKVHSFSEAIKIKQSKMGSRDQIRGDVGQHRLANCLIGKFGEVGAANVVGGSVDFAVWGTGRRGADQFEPDISQPKQQQLVGKHVHVKTCGLKHGMVKTDKFYPSSSSSWTVDVSDPVFRQPSSRDVIVLMFANERGDVYSFGWVAALDVMRLWKPCFSKNMAHKRAIYVGDLMGLVRKM